MIFLGFLAISNWKMLLTILRAGIGAGLLSAVRMIPPALQMGAFDDEFLGGYTAWTQFVNAFIKIIAPANSLNEMKTGSVLGWWEFDMYTGITGVLILALGIAAWLLLRSRRTGFPALICPVAVLCFFSLENYYGLLRFFRIPLFSGERVSSRFLILPFVFILISGLAALQESARGKSYGRYLNAALTLLLLPGIWALWRHLSAWKVTEAARALPKIYTDLSLKVVANHADPQYTTGLWIGLVISCLSAAVLLFRAKRAADQS